MLGGTVSSFRGLAGEVVAGFVSPVIWFTLAIVLIFDAIVIAVLSSVEEQLPDALVFLVLLGIAGWLTGRFAVPAARGEVNAGIMSENLESGEAFGFAIRYLILTFLWAVPVFGIAYLLDLGNPLAQIGSLAGGGLGMEMPGGGLFKALVLLVLVLVSVVAPGCSFIIATMTDEARQVVRLEPWLDLLTRRLPDLTAFFAAAVGAMAVFYAVYAIPFLIIVVLAFKASLETGIYVSTLLPMVPLCGAPILIGRLSGAFVYGASDSPAEISVPVDSGAGTAVPQQPSGAAPAGPGSAGAGAGAAAVQAGRPPVRELSTDPSSELVNFVKTALSSQELAVAGFLYERIEADGSYITALGVEPAEDVNLGAKQQLLRALQNAARDDAAAVRALKITLVEGAPAGDVRRVGLKVYQRR